MQVELIRGVAAGSRTVQTTRNAIAAVDTVAETSRVGARIRQGRAIMSVAWADSATERGAFSGIIGTQRVVESSWTRRSTRTVVERVTDAGTTGLASARTADVWGWVDRKTRQSYLYRWLTTEPEPDVIVIDLRQTYTAGPVIAGLDRGIAELTPGVKSATLTRSVARTLELFKRRPLRYAGITLGLTTATSLLSGVVLDGPSLGFLLVHVTLLGLAVLGIRSETSAVALRAHPVVQWVLAALEPPNPPTSSEEDRPIRDEASSEDE